MKKLNKALLEGNASFPADVEVQSFPENLPERVIQFGEGNFLRAFVDWMIHLSNKNDLFNGRVVIVQPIAEGLAEKINAQDGLYTLLLRGLQDGEVVEQKEVINSISRCINPYTDWDEYLKCAENPSIEFVVSNTTEAGICFDAKDSLSNNPPISFPGKLTAYLYRRFQYFSGSSDKGMIILPCELIDRNGDTLKKVVLQVAASWGLPEEFKQWVVNCNFFLNTLVDRVVTGFPKEEIAEITAHLGYEDELVNTGELFHLWVIEGPAELSEKLPFAKLGLNVIWTNDMTPYRTRKVRILNGAHTSSVPAAFLYGLDTVGEMMDDAVMGQFIRRIVTDEIIPSIKLDKQMLAEFATAVVERFQNPYIKHYLLSILLNSASKFKARVLPSILEYNELHGKLPEKLTFSLAALIAVYKDGKIEDTSMRVSREKGEFIMKDDLSVLEFFASAWSKYDGSYNGAQNVAVQVLSNSALWGEDLTNVSELPRMVGDYLYQIANHGIKAAVVNLVNNKHAYLVARERSC